MCEGQTAQRSLRVLCLGITLILLVQGFWASSGQNVPDSQTRSSVMGLFPSLSVQFVPFYYHAGKIPVVGPSPNFNSADGAAQYVRLNGEALKMDADLWSREGDLARVWLYAPWVVAGGTGRPSVHLGNFLLWSGALVSFFLASWWVGRSALGWATVLLLSMSPFYLYAVHGEENLFWIPGATFLYVAALMLPVAFGYLRVRWMLLAGIVAGVVVGLFGAMRREVWPIALVAVLAPWFRPVPVRSRLLLAACPLVFLLSVDKAQLAYFESEWAESIEYVNEHGGEPALGQRMTGHTFWHPIWCGLGDFGSDKGYAWRDSVAYQYGFGEIRRRFGVDVQWDGSLRLLEKDPPGSSYTRMVGGYPHYEQVLRERVLSDIRADPVWYVRILLLRTNRILAVSTPFNGIGYLAVFVLAWCVATRRWREVWLLGGAVTVSFSALVIYSGDGSTWTGLFGIIGVSIAFHEAIEYAQNWDTTTRHKLGTHRAEAGTAFCRPATADASAAETNSESDEHVGRAVSQIEEGGTVG